MKKHLTFILILASFLILASCTSSTKETGEIYEVACGGCIYDQEGVEGCETWVKLTDGKLVPLAGENISAHKNGLCKAADKARLKGSVVNGKFIATSSELIKAKNNKSSGGHDHGGHSH